MYIFNSCFYCPSFLSTIFLRGRCSINPCFWEGVDVVCQTFLLSSCIALSFHTTRKNYATLIHSFGRGLILYIYIQFFSFKNLSYHPSLLCQSMLLGGGGCCMPIFFYHPTLPCHSILLGKNYSTILPLFTPLGGD